MSTGIDSRYTFTDEGEMVRKDTQDVSEFLDANRRERISGENDQSGMNGRKFASVPLIVLQQLKDQLGIDYNLVGIDPDHTGRFFVWLGENHAYRTSEARLANGNRYLQ